MKRGVRRASLTVCLGFVALAPHGSAARAPLGATASLSPTSTAAAPLRLGFYDGVFTGPDASVWLGRAASAGSDVVRIDIGWDAPDTPKRPQGFDPENPADPNYDFAAADAAIKAAAAHGMRVIALFSGAPQWAEGSHIPAHATPGSWKPNPADIRAYAMAIGKRYSGDFPDPSNPRRKLPRVWAFQFWNEPNLPQYLSPQWVGSRAESPVLYRNMLNAFYAGIKSVDPSALVVTAGTAPFGDPGTGGRIMPALFWRDVLCVREVGVQLESAHCADPAHFDVLAHHPYSVGEPDTKALNADDVSIPDIGKLTRILRFAESTGEALPHIRHTIWVTEVGYNTDPPNRQGVKLTTAARWLEQTLELLWSQGVSLITWNTIVDQSPIPNYSETSQSGIYFIDGQPKSLLLSAFRFPVVATRTSPSELTIWGRSPAKGRVVIERQVGSAWKPVASLAVNIADTFLTHLVDTGPVVLRAEIGSYTSLPWVQG